MRKRRRRAAAHAVTTTIAPPLLLRMKRDGADAIAAQRQVPLGRQRIPRAFALRASHLPVQVLHDAVALHGAEAAQDLTQRGGHAQAHTGTTSLLSDAEGGNAASGGGSWWIFITGVSMPLEAFRAAESATRARLPRIQADATTVNDEICGSAEGGSATPEEDSEQRSENERR